VLMLSEAATSTSAGVENSGMRAPVRVD
jgi:hypothetical protein